MEYLDLYDKNKQFTGNTILRKQRSKMLIPENMYYIVTLIFIQNSKNEFLFQFTSKEKGSVFAVTGGHVKSGKTSLETIIEETFEEIGLTIFKEEISLFKTYINNQVIADVYYLKKDVDINTLVFQKEEVDYARFFTLNELSDIIKRKKMRLSNIKVLSDILESLSLPKIK